jgi:O-antigen/teichoic acid export membrane protein
MAGTSSRTGKAVILSSGQFFVTLNGIILAAILARLISKEDYAAYQQTLLTYYIAGPLLALGLPSALFYFIPRDRSRARSILTGNLLLLMLAGGFFAAVMWCGGSELISQRFRNPGVRGLLLIYAPYAVLALPVSAVGACLLSCGRTATAAAFQAGARAVTLFCVVGLVLLWRAPRAAISGTVVAEFAVFLAALVIMYRIAPGDSWRPQIANIRDQMRFAVPLGLATMIGVLSRSVDKVVVSSMCSPEQFAVYVNGAIDIPLIGILTGSVTSVLMPEIVELYSKGDSQAALAIWRRAAVKCSLILLPAMCFLFIMAPEVMRLLFSARYSASATPFRMYLLLVPIRIVAWGPMLMAAGKSSWILSRTAISLGVNLVLSIILVRYFGYIGAIVGSICELYLWAIPFHVCAISKLYRCPIQGVLPLGRVSFVMLLSLVACLVFLAVPHLHLGGDLVTVIVFGVLYACLYVGLITMTGVFSPARLWASLGLYEKGRLLRRLGVRTTN